MEATLGWNCDFCGKPCIVLSSSNVLYCENCKMSYGEVFEMKESTITCEYCGKVIAKLILLDNNANIKIDMALCGDEVQ